MLSALHSALVNSRSRLLRRAWEVAHRQLSRRFNPEVCVPIAGRRLRMAFSHPLPFMLARFPRYDTLLPRLARALIRRDGGLRMIDVGANIGDTVALTLAGAEARILAIEPDPDYFRLLRENTRDLPAVTCVATALTEAESAEPAVLAKVRGTAHVTEAGGTTLDHLLAAYPEFGGAKLLKVDTDGFDFKVLKGARRYLAAARPAVFLELAPRYYEEVGREDPLAVFAFLAEAGYGTFVVYDNEGWLVFAGTPADTGVYAQLIAYARAKGHYYDVLALPAAEGAFAADFVAAEQQDARQAAEAAAPL